jgi:leishmanolysin
MFNRTTKKSYTNILLPGLIDMAKKYFKCEDIKGIPLENEGGSDSKGSHFEKLWFGNEIMIADENLNMKISAFTFKFLEETGWYKPIYKRRERLTYLWGESCTILNSRCSDHSRVCDPKIKGPICSYDYTGIGECKQGDEFTDGCPLFSSNNIDCRNPDHATRNGPVGMDFGYGRRCFEGMIEPDLFFGNEGDPQRQAFCAKPKC